MLTVKQAAVFLYQYKAISTYSCVAAMFLTTQVRNFLKTPSMILFTGIVALFSGASVYSLYQVVTTVINQETLAQNLTGDGKWMFMIANAASLGLAAVGAGLITYALTMPGILNPISAFLAWREENQQQDMDKKLASILQRQEDMHPASPTNKAKRHLKNIQNTFRSQRQAARQPGRRIAKRSHLIKPK